jgi:predicted alpha/beta superfamily hydrolase
LVGIATVDRRRDFTFPTTLESDKKRFPTSGHSEKFIDFIESELQPYIEKKYHGNLSKMIIGQSLGGLLATEILLKRPHLFNKYLIISPSLWWDNGSLLQLNSTLSQSDPALAKDVYISVGKEGLTPTEIPRVMEDDARMLTEKLKRSSEKSLKVYFDYLPEEDHATISHQAIMNGLKKLYQP